MKGLPVFVRRHLLISALLLSALLHLLLFLPAARQPQPVTRVLNADIRVEKPRAALASQPAPQVKENPAPAAENKTPTAPQPVPTSGKIPASTALNANVPLKEVAVKPVQPALAENTNQQAAAEKVTGDHTTEPPALSEAPAQPGLNDAQDELSEDPLERSYQQRILAHLRQQMQAPAALSGSVRLSLTLRYKSIATDVQVIRSSGNQQLDDWAVKAAIAANPYPPVPDGFAEPYIFRPTIRTAP